MNREFLENSKKNVIDFIKNHKFLVAFLLSVIIIIFRRPDAILNAQFWAEDGVIWFADAYNNGGLTSLLHPQNGYFQSISRLTAWLSLSVPLQFSPLFFNIIAIAIKAFPVAFLWSNRFTRIIPSNKARLIISASYLLLPVIGEVHSNITNAHWHLALYAFMILIARFPKSTLGKMHDIFFLILSGLSGPFSVLLSPIALIYGWVKRKSLPNFYYIYLLIILSSASIQIASVIFTSEATRSQAPLGASVALFIKLISAKLFGVVFLGEKSVNDIASSIYLALPIFIIGAFIVFYTLWKATIELKLFIFFSALMLFAALHSPMVSSSESQWPLMGNKSTGARYFFIPLITWTTSLIWFLSAIKMKKIEIILMLLTGIFVIHTFIVDFKLKPYKDFDFPKHAEEFKSLPPGTMYKIPINPKKWEMILIKK